MLKIHPSAVADTRTCNVTKVTKEQLLKASKQHIGDVQKGLRFIANQLLEAADRHDHDKVTPEGIELFHKEFTTLDNFGEDSTWLENHYKVNRHHLETDRGIRENVDLVDVVEAVVDGVMAGMGRAGRVRDSKISPGVLYTALNNTVAKLAAQVEVVPLTESCEEPRDNTKGLTPGA